MVSNTSGKNCGSFNNLSSMLVNLTVNCIQGIEKDNTRKRNYQDKSTDFTGEKQPRRSFGKTSASSAESLRTGPGRGHAGII
jgi:hypothetical protein